MAQIITVDRLRNKPESFFKNLKEAELVYENGRGGNPIAVLVSWDRYLESLPPNDEYITDDQFFRAVDNWPPKYKRPRRKGKVKWSVT